MLLTSFFWGQLTQLIWILIIYRKFCYDFTMNTKINKFGKPSSKRARRIPADTGEMHISLVSPAAKKARFTEGKPAEVAMTVKFGSVTVKVHPPHKAEVERNVKAGQSALARARETLIKSGIKMKIAKGVPIFHADAKLPGQLVRRLDGKSESGMFVNGKFKFCM